MTAEAKSTATPPPSSSIQAPPPLPPRQPPTPTPARSAAGLAPSSAYPSPLPLPSQGRTRVAALATTAARPAALRAPPPPPSTTARRHPSFDEAPEVAALRSAVCSPCPPPSPRHHGVVRANASSARAGAGPRGHARRTPGRGGNFMVGGARTMEALSKVIQKIRVARDGHLGYGPGDRFRLLRATRQAARHLAAGVSFTRQGASRLELPMSALKEHEPSLKACVASWGACSLLSSHVKNATGMGPRCRSDGEPVDCDGDGKNGVMVLMVAWCERGRFGVRRDETLRRPGVGGRHVAMVGGASSVDGRAGLMSGRD